MSEGDICYREARRIKSGWYVRNSDTGEWIEVQAVLTLKSGCRVFTFKDGSRSQKFDGDDEIFSRTRKPAQYEIRSHARQTPKEFAKNLFSGRFSGTIIDIPSKSPKKQILVQAVMT